MKAKYTLDKAQEMLFALLRTALNEEFNEEDRRYFDGCSDKEWIDCLNLADDGGVTALACHAMTLLPDDEMRPSTDIRLECLRVIYEAEGMHRLHCQTVGKMEEMFHPHGIGMMVMKGVGMSAYYPTPYLRKCGDIDIFTYSLDQERMSDEEANGMSDQVIRKAGVTLDDHYYKHSTFKYDGVEVENHKFFLNIEGLKEAVELDRLLRRIKAPERVKLMGEYEVTIPSPTFNAIFIAFHASQHFGNILTVYHLVDWACILKKHGMIIPEGVHTEGFMRFVNSLTALSNRLLGTHVETEADPELENVILSEMFTSKQWTKASLSNPIRWFTSRVRCKVHEVKMQRYIYDISVWTVIRNVMVYKWKKIAMRARG